LTARLAKAKSQDERIRQAYHLLFGREPTNEELRIGKEYVAAKESAWLPYTQVLLSSNELLFVN